jgi:hypothetical protein
MKTFKILIILNIMRCMPMSAMHNNDLALEQIVDIIAMTERKHKLEFAYNVMKIGLEYPDIRLTNFEKQALEKIVKKPKFQPLLLHFFKSLDDTPRGQGLQNIILQLVTKHNRYVTALTNKAHG